VRIWFFPNWHTSVSRKIWISIFWRQNAESMYVRFGIDTYLISLWSWSNIKSLLSGFSEFHQYKTKIVDLLIHVFASDCNIAVSRKIWTATICARKICVLSYIKKLVKLRWDTFYLKLYWIDLKLDIDQLRFGNFFSSVWVFSPSNNICDFPWLCKRLSERKSMVAIFLWMNSTRILDHNSKHFSKIKIEGWNYCKLCGQ
jgi:hypothetical protein